MGVEVFGGPKVDLPAVVAAEKAQVADGIASSSSAAYCHLTTHKNPSQHRRCMVCEHTVPRVHEVRRGERRARLRLNLLEPADGVRDWAAAEEERQLHGASHGDEGGSGPAA